MIRTILFFLLAAPAFCPAAAVTDTTYSVEINASACPVISFYRYDRYPGGSSAPTLGYALLARAMWHPSRMLAMGIFSGYLFIVEDVINSQESATARLAAIPLQAAVSMQGRYFEIGLGMGPYIMRSDINFASPAHGLRFELGLTFFADCLLPVSSNAFLCPGLKVLYLSYRGILSIMPSVNFRYDIYRY